jgi:hypothetical protein
MGLGSRIIANSSNGTGIRVSMAGGKRFEDFLNSSSNWFYAEEEVVEGTFNSVDLKAPSLGSLTIFRKSGNQKGDGILVAVFPKGSWEFVRLLDGEVSASGEVGYKDPDQDARHNCPEGCWVRGWEDLSSKNKKVHMDFFHKPKRS